MAMTVFASPLVVVLLCISHAVVVVSQAAADSPIRKVVTLIEAMKAQVEKEADEDVAAYNKYMCWCDTNEKEKTAAIKGAQEQIAILSASVSEAAGKISQLKADIETLQSDIADDEDCLKTATAVRENDEAQFLTAEADMKETRGLLGQALQVLSKVQLAQTTGKAVEAQKAVNAVLLQLRHRVIGKHFERFKGLVQRDLFDMLDAWKEVAEKRVPGAFLDASTKQTEDGEAAQSSGAGPVGKSYNSGSGEIVGVLSAMHDEFTKDLTQAQTDDLEAEIRFQKLRASKLSEISAAKEQKEAKDALLAEMLDKSEKAKEDTIALQDAIAADEEFLRNMRTSCSSEDEEHAARVQVRGDEIIALAETLKILTQDDARDVFTKTISFVQLDSTRSGVTARMKAQNRASERAMQRIAEVARRHKSWTMASLAVRVRLDGFSGVQKAMDKMIAELQKHQKEEYEKMESCKSSIDKAEDSIKEGIITKEDLAEKHTELVNTIATLTTSIKELKKEVLQMEVSLKQAGQERKQQNTLFQQSVTDQRATVNILGKAKARLKAFYEQSSLVQVRVHHRMLQKLQQRQPSTPKYEKSVASGGVLQLLTKIIKDAEKTERELASSEQKSQQDYSLFVKDTKSSIDAVRSALEAKQKQRAEAESEKSETEEAQLANNVEVSKLQDLLKAHHLDCDFVLKYFDIRQKSREEEINAITDAKSILSGADFPEA